MHFRALLALGVLLTLGLPGYTTADLQTVWPEPRPLGKGLPTYRPPAQPPHTALSIEQAAEPTGALTLRQALAIALLHNPELAAFGWEVRAGEARTLQASLRPNPELALEVENFAGSGEVRGFDQTEFTLSLSQLIELGGKRLKRMRVAAFERDLAAWDYEAKRLEVFTQVAQAFVEVLSAQERVALQADLVRLAEQVLSTAAERVKAGKVSPVEETKARVALSNSRIALENARRALAAARQRLAATWGGTTPLFTRAEGSLEAVAAIPPFDQLTTRVLQNPDIARWVTETARRQAAVELAQARRMPDLTVSGGVRHGRETGDSSLVASFSIPLPIFDRNQGGFLEARSQLARAGAERRAAEVQVYAALGERYAVLATAFDEATTLKHDVLPGARLAFEAASEGYRQGKFSFLEVLDAQRTLFEARGQYLDALAAYHKAVADMERLLGEGLSAVAGVTGP